MLNPQSMRKLARLVVYASPLAAVACTPGLAPETAKLDDGATIDTAERDVRAMTPTAELPQAPKWPVPSVSETVEEQPQETEVNFPHPLEKPVALNSDAGIFDPDQLIGLEPDQTVALLGIPPSVREEPPAKVWIYDSKFCTLDVFFYLDIGSDSFHALAYDVTVTDSSEQARLACLSQIQAEYGASSQ